MNHIAALSLKATIIFFALSIVLSLFNGYAIWNTLGLALIITAVAYVVGDLLILRLSNNTLSTVLDIGMCTLLIWLVGPLILNQPVSFLVAFLASIAIGAGEWLFHKYVTRTIFKNNESGALT
ncbi:DUF2512 family protein [Bacillus piscicola]|uniref:DUF2512 family protein n=1 Tax=Bacillus piscicola TaxID=1632684 RepID=UPI001F093137|nr:DUF2512 family protein [Bacillus piscicola]